MANSFLTIDSETLLDQVTKPRRFNLTNLEAMYSTIFALVCVTSYILIVSANSNSSPSDSVKGMSSKDIVNF